MQLVKDEKMKDQIQTADEKTGRMHSVLQNGYGGVDMLGYGQTGIPDPKDDEVQVEVHAAAVNKGDWHMLTGKPYIVRLVAGGFKKPAFRTPGQELAGRVTAVGSAVTKFKVGDDVFGDADSGAFAEFACVPENRLALKPAATAYSQAAAVPAGGITALQTLRDILKLEAGQSVLINGGAGGVGTFAVQIAKSMGAEVSVVCSGKNRTMVQSLGADRVIDYTSEDFTAHKERFDCMLDLVGRNSHKECRSVLKPDGKYAGVAGGNNNWVGPMFSFLKMMFTSLFNRKKMVPYFYNSNGNDLEVLSRLIEEGKLRPAVTREYKLADTHEAFAMQGTGRANGKSVLLIK